MATSVGLGVSKQLCIFYSFRCLVVEKLRLGISVWVSQKERELETLRTKREESCNSLQVMVSISWLLEHYKAMKDFLKDNRPVLDTSNLYAFVGWQLGERNMGNIKQADKANVHDYMKLCMDLCCRLVQDREIALDATQE